MIKSFYKDKSILKNYVNNQKSYSKINTMEKILNEIENITDEKINIGKKEIIHFVGIGGIGMSGLAQIMKMMDF